MNLITGSMVNGSKIKFDASGTFRYVCNVTNAVGSSTNQITIKVEANGTGKSSGKFDRLPIVLTRVVIVQQFFYVIHLL